MAMNVATKAGSDAFAWVDNADLAKAFIRVNLGFLLIWHGINFMQGGFDGTTTNQLDRLAGIGIPAFLGYPLGVFLEVICPILAILGIYTRLVALGMVIFMLFAIGLAHVTNGHLFMLAQNNAGFFDAYYLERQFFFLWNAVALVFMGGGRYGLNIGGRWNN